MNIQILLIEGGFWWNVTIDSTQELVDILNTGRHLGTTVAAVKYKIDASPFTRDSSVVIYDFISTKYSVYEMQGN